MYSFTNYEMLEIYRTIGYLFNCTVANTNNSAVLRFRRKEVYGNQGVNIVLLMTVSWF